MHQVLEKMPQRTAAETWYIGDMECPRLQVQSPWYAMTGHCNEHT